MNKAFLPNDDYMIISFRDLEIAWKMLAYSNKHAYVQDTVKAVQEVNRLIGPEKAIFNMLTATAWLVSDDPLVDTETRSHDG